MLIEITALKDMGDESLVGIVDLVSGERDPRNLMLIFSILRVLMVEWDISNNVEVRPLIMLHEIYLINVL